MFYSVFLFIYLYFAKYVNIIAKTLITVYNGNKFLPLNTHDLFCNNSARPPYFSPVRCGCCHHHATVLCFGSPSTTATHRG
ncbi:hypothetical protein [Moraxella lacunata]|uniref:hypothetical protein n=1 Tax=Moraxella lacunata TaxID=477 RepID=UPI003EE118F2